MKPDSKLHNSDPEHIKSLIAKTGMTRLAVSNVIGISNSSLSDYLNPKHPSVMPYSVQFCLEVLGNE